MNSRSSGSHRCGKLLEAHPIRQVTDPTGGSGAPHRFDGERCLCHGHCGDCGEPVVMCRLGRFHHVSAYKARA